MSATATEQTDCIDEQYRKRLRSKAWPDWVQVRQGGGGYATYTDDSGQVGLGF